MNTHYIIRCLVTRSRTSSRGFVSLQSGGLTQAIYCKDRNITSVNQTSWRRLAHSSGREIVFKSPRSNIEIPVVSLTDYMFPRLSKYGDKKAMVDDTSSTEYSYSQLEDLSRKVASFLYKKGLRKNDVICHYSTNTPECAILLLACASSGIVLTLANPAYTSGELKRHMDHSGAQVLVTVPQLVPNAKEANVKDIIVFGQSEGCQSFSDAIADDGKSFPKDITIDPLNDVLILPYSSGTTGLPKGVMVTHYNLVANLLQFKQSTSTSADDINLAVLPFYHIYGIVLLLCDTLQSGGTLVTTPGFEPERFLKAIIEHKVTQLHLVPPLAIFLARHPIVDKFDISRVHSAFCGAAPLGETVTAELKNKRNITIRQGYGLTETSPIITVDYVEDVTYGTVGPLIPNTEGKFIDLKTGESLGRNETGELCVRGPQNMKGYLNNDKATRDMIDEDGWLHTGDIGHIEDNDCIVITDRLKELIKYKGKQVAPAELEDLLHKHPAVQDVAVIGMPDDRAGELPRAYVVLKPDNSPHAEDIMKYVEDNASDFKRLRGGVEFVKEIPKTPSGKILRRVLRDQLASTQE